MAGETRTVTWSGGPTGDYITNGSDDHVEINLALTWADGNGNTVHLKGPHTYYVSASVKPGSSTVFTADDGVVIKVAASADQFVDGVGIIDQLNSTLTGLEISNIELDGNLQNRPASYANSGGGDHNAERAIDFRGGSTNFMSDIYIHDCYIHSFFSDGVHIAWAKNCRVKNNVIKNCQHSGIFVIEVIDSNNDLSNNTIEGCTSDCIRLDNCQNVIVHHNTLSPYLGTDTNGGWSGGISGIQVADEGYSHNGGSPKPHFTNNIQIYDNEISNIGSTGIWINDAQNTAGALAQVVHIYNNEITNCGNYGNAIWSAGISFNWGNGVTIENNTINGCHVAGILFYNVITSSSSFTATVRKNNIVTTMGVGSSTPALGVSNCGYGIYRRDSIASKLSISIDGNYFYNNLKGSVYPTTLGHTNDSDTFITESLTDGDTDTDDEETDDTIKSIYIPPSASVIDTDYYARREATDFRGYINSIPFYCQSFTGQGGKVLGTSKSPSLAGRNISDFDFDGSDVQFTCVADDLEELYEALAAFYKRGRSYVELGGPFKGYMITGSGDSHKASFSKDEGDAPEDNLFYTLNFKGEKPYMEWIDKHSRSRYCYNSMQFTSNDVFTGNKVRNPSFESWTPNNALTWSAETTPNTNEYRRVHYAKDLKQFCVVASTGTDNRIIVKDEDGSWRYPTGLMPSNLNNDWKGLTRADEWNLWIACSSTGTQDRCITSTDGDNWGSEATPSAADSNAWQFALWIPPDDTLTTGRVVFFANSGTNRVMYSDDQCSTFTLVASANESATWERADYNPDTHRIVAVAYSGEVMYSDDYAATWTAVTAPSQRWTSIVYADLLELWVACSDNGTQQVMTSTTGISDWTLQDTPYESSSTSGGGTVVATTVKQSTAGWNYTSPGTSYTDAYNPMYPTESDTTFTLPALSEGHIYRIDEAHCRLRSVDAGYTASMEATYQVGTGSEVKFAEWTETSTSYQSKSASVAIECETGQTLRIRFRIKSSVSGHRAGADLMGYTITELTASGSEITYVRPELSCMTWAKEVGLLVSLSAVDYVAIYSTTGTYWSKIQTLPDHVWESLCYANDQLKFEAVSTDGAVMTCDNYGLMAGVAPNSWTWRTAGQDRSDEFAIDGEYAYHVTGDGVLEQPGLIDQIISFDGMYDSGIMYILSGWGKVTGLTSGTFSVDIYAGGTVIKELSWTEDTEYIQKEIKFKFDSVPATVQVRVHGNSTPNVGSEFWFDNMFISKESDIELALNGSDIKTTGKYDVMPDVTIRSVGVDISSPSTGRTVNFVTSDEDVFSTVSPTFALVNTFTFSALTGGSAYRFDELGCQIHSANANGYCYVKVTIQSASLYGGLETPISLWSSNQASGYKIWNYTLPYLLQSATDETVTLKFYMRVSSASYRGYAKFLRYKYTEVLDAATVADNGLYLYNIADTSRVMKCCTALPKNCMVQIKADGTGSYRHVESFEDGTYAETAYNITGSVSRNSETNTLLIGASSSIEFCYDTLYPVAGIPFAKVYAVSGTPQFFIADDSGTDGAPGTYYGVTGNILAVPVLSDIQRDLDNTTSLRLRGGTKYYVKIAPKAGETCEIGQYFEYASLDTQDAERFYIYSTGEANTIALLVDGTGKCSVITTLDYRDANILP